MKFQNVEIFVVTIYDSLPMLFTSAKERPPYRSFLAGLCLVFVVDLVLMLPDTSHMLGWGDDPAFNLWTFEQVWAKIHELGLPSVMTRQFWSLPIFSPVPLTLALSENQIFPALLTYPLHFFGSVWALEVFAILMGLTSYCSTYLWLKANPEFSAFLERREEARPQYLPALGAVLFALCGWMQTHIAHYQNLCIFVFPLALIFLDRFRKAPSVGRAVLGGLAVGWVAGWNMYFQVALNFIFSIYAVSNTLQSSLLGLDAEFYSGCSSVS